VSITSLLIIVVAALCCLVVVTGAVFGVVMLVRANNRKVG
jgi:hypothetical protein